MMHFLPVMLNEAKTPRQAKTGRGRGQNHEVEAETEAKARPHVDNPISG